MLAYNIGMTFNFNYTASSGPGTAIGSISFAYGEGSDWHNRKAKTIEASIKILTGDNWVTVGKGTSKMVSDHNDPDFGRELAMTRAMDEIAPSGVKVISVLDDMTVSARAFRTAVWSAWRQRSVAADGTVLQKPVKDSTRRAWREYRQWVREHGRGPKQTRVQAATQVA